MPRFISLVLCLVVAVHADHIRLSVQLPPDSRHKLLENLETCIDQSGIQPDVLMRLREHERIVEDEHSEKFVLCMFRRLDLDDDSGHLKIPRVADFLDMPNNKDLIEILEECNTRTGSNPMETAANIFLCGQDELNVNYGI